MKMATSGQPPMDAGKRPSRLDTLRLAAPQPKSLLQTALLRIRFYRLQILWTLLFFLFQAFLVGMGVLEYYEEYERVRARRPFSVFNLVAYAFGSVIRVNAAVFLLFPAYRGILSYLRRSVLSRVVPFDSWILFHMIVAYTTGVCVVIHVGCFVAHFYRSAQRPDAIKGNRTVWTYLFKAGSVGSEYLGATNISGWVMVGALLVMFVCSLPPVRHSRFYDLFYWTHKLQFVFWAALIVHEPIFWRVFVAFCVLLLAEKARVYFNAFRWACQPVHIRHVTLLPAQVARITLNRPSCFSYNPGDYVFLRIPSLGLLSWHPFTLTSSPDNKETISFHVKAAGNWTRRLPKRLQASSLNADDALSTASLHASSSKVAILELDQMDPPTPVLGARDPKGHPPTLRHSVLVNGPYASSSTNLRWTRHALLVAGGIGVTPFASILRGLLSQYKILTSRERCPGCGNTAPVLHTASRPFQYAGRPLPLEQVDFIWVCREMEALQWFGDLWREWAYVQREHADACPGRFLVAQVFVTQNGKLPPDSGVAVQKGRPEWDLLFGQILARKAGVTLKERRAGMRVFTCGPRPLEDAVREKCILYQLPLTWEVFA